MVDYKKLYEDLVDRVKRMAKAQPLVTKKAIEMHFPEIVESEDERIRKSIIGFLNTISSLKDGKTVSNEDFDSKEILEWAVWLEKRGETFTKKDVDDAYLKGVCDTKHELEKQGEQKPADKVEPKFHEGDIIIHKELGGDYIHNSHKIIQVDILDRKYRLEGGLVAHFSEQDDYELVEQKPAWSEEDEAVLDALIRRLEGEDVYVSPHLAVECLKSLKERIQPKQEWSKEDEYYYTKLENFLDVRSHYEGKSQYQDEVKETLNWLKSLRPQNHWKPSEEQMEALDDFIYAKYPNIEKHGAAVKSLYQDLKRL